MSVSLPPLSMALLDFIQTGAFCGVGLGQNVKVVREYLGPEQTVYSFDDMLTLRWDSFPAELTFDGQTGVLWWLQLDLNRPEVLAALFEGLTDFSAEAVAAYLHAHGVIFREEVCLNDQDEEVNFHLPNGIEFGFCAEKNAGSPAQLVYIGQSSSQLPHLELYA